MADGEHSPTQHPGLEQHSPAWGTSCGPRWTSSSPFSRTRAPCPCLIHWRRQRVKLARCSLLQPDTSAVAQHSTSSSSSRGSGSGSSSHLTSLEPCTDAVPADMMPWHLRQTTRQWPAAPQTTRRSGRSSRLRVRLVTPVLLYQSGSMWARQATCAACSPKRLRAEYLTL